MRFSSSNWRLGLCLLAAPVLVLTFASCSLKPNPEERLSFPKIASLPQTSLPPAKRRGSWLTDLYEPTSGLTACQWLLAATRPVGIEERFQLLDGAKVSIEASPDPTSSQDQPSASPFPNEAFAKAERTTSRATNGKDRFILEFNGTVDSGGSPLYSYALLSQTIPSKKEFLALVKQEIEKTSGFPFKLLLGEWLMKVGVVDAYKQRNRIIEERVNEVLPGIFAPEKKSFRIRDSLPWIFLMKGSPELAANPQRLSTSPSEMDQLKAQQELHQRALDYYAKSVPVFSGTTWNTLSDDFREGLSTAIRAFKTRDPEQKACATTILHRTLSQLFMIIGYDRLPFEVRKGGEGFHLPPLPELLDSKEGTRFMVCPTAGSFVSEGHRVIIDRDVLTGFNPDQAIYDLSAGPQPLRICNRRDAVPYSFDLHKGFKDEPVAHLAQGSDWLALINSFAQFLTAFNPGAPWWHDPENSIGFPMAPFESLERIKASGAILPADANALSLGLLNLSLASFMKKHLVFLDDANRHITDMNLAAKIRVSEETFDPSDPLLQTTIASAVHLAETAFKLGETLKTLAAWFVDAEATFQADLAAETDPRKKALLLQDYNGFMEGMYGSIQTLRDLTASGPDTLREKVESLKLASALLLTEFAEKDPIDGAFGCVARLDLDLSSGKEIKRGTCSLENKRLWKYALKLVSLEFRSPHYGILAE